MSLLGSSTGLIAPKDLFYLVWLASFWEGSWRLKSETPILNTHSNSDLCPHPYLIVHLLLFLTIMTYFWQIEKKEAAQIFKAINTSGVPDFFILPLVSFSNDLGKNKDRVPNAWGGSRGRGGAPAEQSMGQSQAIVLPSSFCFSDYCMKGLPHQSQTHFPGP